jgi:peptide/nickel transport system substrate-binding protein
MTKKPLLSPIRVGASIALLLLAACSGDSRSNAGLPAFCQEVLPRVAAFLGDFEHPTGEGYGGTAVVGSIGEIADGMNALVSSDYTGSQHQTFLNLMTLIQVDEDLRPVPYLAESWEMNPEETEVTFRLRDDVYWHDGTLTTAHDVEFTYLRALDPETAFPNLANWTYYDQGPGGVEVLDDRTIRFRFAPHTEPLDPWRSTAIMPRHLLEEVPPAELKQHPFGSRCPVGNGPFVFSEHRTDESWTFTRNPAFPEGLGGPPFLDRYVYRIIPEQTTLLTSLLTENIDFYIAPLPDQAPQIEAAPHLVFRVFPFRTYVFVGWNARRPQVADARVRRAITVGTNRAEIVQALLSGYGEIANAGVPPFHWAHNPDLRDSLSYDPEEARALLEEAGWTDRNGDGIRENARGVPLEITIKYNTGNQQRQDIAEIMQSQLRGVGISIRPQVVEWATLLNQINTPDLRDFDGVIMGWVTEFKIDDHDLFHSSKVDLPYGWAGTEDPDLDRLLDTLQVVSNREDATELWQEYQYRIIRLQPYTYFYFPERLAGLNRRLQGVTLDARGEWVSVHDWRISSGTR